MRLDIAPELLPFEHRFVALDGARIHYLSEGTGETVLLLHGNPAWSFLYRKIIAGLKDDFHCVAPVFPGYGLSSAPPGYGYTPREHSAFLERFVDALELRDLTLMVQDWGGPIGLGLAGRRPELIRGLIIGNTFAWPNREPATIGPHQLVAASDYLAEIEANLPKLADRPALIVWGAKDFAFDESHRTRFEAAFPNHRTIVYPDASHFLQEDVGDRIAEAFKAFRGPAAPDLL